MPLNSQNVKPMKIENVCRLQTEYLMVDGLSLSSGQQSVYCQSLTMCD